MILVNKNEDGKKFYRILGPSHLVAEKQNEISQKESKIQWSEKDISNIPPPETVLDFAKNLKRKSLRRLAAKVAYERWGQLRNPYLLNDGQFEMIREFILTGVETRPCCGIIVDRQMLSTLLNFSVGHHGVFIFAHPKSRILGSFVTFYSLFYFWVVLSSNYQALSPIDDPLIEDPQDQIIHEPLLRAGSGDLLVHWNQIARPYLSNPESASINALRYGFERFVKASNEFYNSNNIKDAQPRH